MNRTPESDWLDYHANRSVENRNRLVNRYLYLVYYVADRMYKYLKHQMEFNEIVSCGAIGLTRAIEMAAEGVKFHRYAMVRIRGEILDYCRSTGVFSRSMIHRHKVHGERLVSFSPLNSAVSQDVSMVDAGHRMNDLDMLRTVTSGLGKMDRLIVIMVYFMDFSLADIGRHFGVSRSSISLKHKAIVESIRERFDAEARH